MNENPQQIKTDEKAAKQSSEDYLAVWISTDIAIGLVLGAAFDNIPMGLALGVALGAAVGAAGNGAKAKE